MTLKFDLDYRPYYRDGEKLPDSRKLRVDEIQIAVRNLVLGLPKSRVQIENKIKQFFESRGNGRK